ncbi:MAG TPA: MFS transporter [Blastocatellia bacterium]|nr:MFS transporter [Blastocatellia bacterium]
MNSTGIRWRLSLMMLLQYVVWGAWYPVYSAYLERRGFTGSQMGWIYALLPLGSMIAPFIGGQLADRYFPTEKLLVAFHLAGGVVMMAAARATTFEQLLPLMALWSLLYAPTLALTNSITFHHLPDAEKKFGLVRVFGTIGWIAAAGMLSGLRYIWPEEQGLPGLGGADSLWLGGFFSLVLGLFCFAIPKTPPARSGASPWAFLSALKLLRDPQFVIFILIAFIVATEVMFFFVLTAPFLTTLGVSSRNMPWVMSIAQIAEIGMMVSLPWLLQRWGVRKTMAFGMLAWPIRYAIFAYGQPKGLVIASLAIHGICYVCFFVVAYIYTNSVATPDIRASAQALITFVLIGAGMFMGSKFTGWIKDTYTTGQTVDYTKVFLVPFVLTLIAAVAFFLAFRDRRATLQPELEGKAG